LEVFRKWLEREESDRQAGMPALPTVDFGSLSISDLWFCRRRGRSQPGR